RGHTRNCPVQLSWAVRIPLSGVRIGFAVPLPLASCVLCRLLSGCGLPANVPVVVVPDRLLLCALSGSLPPGNRGGAVCCSHLRQEALERRVGARLQSVQPDLSGRVGVLPSDGR